MKIQLLKGIKIDLDNVPYNLEKIVQAAFAEYTAETNPAYTFEDKLLFIDQTVKKLHGATDPDYIVNRLFLGHFKTQLDWHGHLPSPDEFIEEGFFANCVSEGMNAQKLYSFEYAESRHDCEKIMQVLVRVITAVMLYEKPEV